MAITHKKILYVITKSNFGGAGHYVFDLATAMQKAGHSVAVACGGNGLLVEKLQEQNIRTITIPDLERDVNISKEFSVLKSLRTIYKQERPDVVHLNSSKIGGIGALAGRLEKVPKIIFTAHGWAFNEDRSYVWKFTTYWISWLTVLLSHITITISRREEEQALSFPFVGVKKVRMIYNGVRTPALLSREDARGYLKNQCGVQVEDTTLLIGSIGELHANKGYDDALDVCKQLIVYGQKFLYVVIGEGEERRRLERRIHEEGLDTYVTLVGAVPDATSSATLLQAFDVFFLPSRKEGLPYVLLEAGLAHRAVVATHVGGVPEIVIDGKTGFLAEPKNIQLLANHVKQLLLDNRVREDVGTRLQKTIEEEFGLGRMIAHTRFEYENG